MVIEWLGHACFKVTLKNSKVILFDPFDKTVGYPYSDIETDVVVISHDHYDHNDLSHVKGDFDVIKTEGSHNIGDFIIECIKTWHDCSKGSQRGENLVSLVKRAGISLCHMGDIGCIPSDEVFEKLAGVDILLIPVGGTFTIDAREALEICERISPNIIIPMHFSTPALKMNIAPVDDFLEAAASEYDVSRLGKCSFEIDKTSLKKRTRIVVMEYL